VPIVAGRLESVGSDVVAVGYLLGLQGVVADLEHVVSGGLCGGDGGGRPLRQSAAAIAAAAADGRRPDRHCKPAIRELNCKFKLAYYRN
jgi:hypothetical protein